MKNKYTFGPIVSRRLGLSLGVDLVPKKKCNLDCLYCEVCPTDKHDEKRIHYIKIDELIKEIKETNAEIDYITLTGSGEPTLHLELDSIISRLKENFSYPIVMLTNSLLLREKNIRKELLGLDLLVPSLDAVSQDIFEKINRPVKNVKAIDVLEGIKSFRQEFSGKIWLEILLAKDINDNEQEVSLLKQAINDIKPDKVQLNTVIRPPAFNTIYPLTTAELKNIAKKLNYRSVEIIGDNLSNKGKQTLNDDNLINYLQRRPALFEELLNAFDSSATQLRENLTKLKTKKETFENMVFFKY
jgi:wyosine [tRNA(Phe)-imidazoG37] synthetase (radical SAM superfamily)